MHKEKCVTRVVISRVGKGGKPRCQAAAFHSKNLLISTTEGKDLPLLLSKSKPINMLYAPYTEFAAWAGAWAIALENQEARVPFWKLLASKDVKNLVAICKNGDTIEDWEGVLNSLVTRMSIVNNLRYLQMFSLNQGENYTSVLTSAIKAKYKKILRRQAGGSDVSVELKLLSEVMNKDGIVNTESPAFKQIFVETEHVKRQYEDSGYWI
jgi:hypothetical protein